MTRNRKQLVLLIGTLAGFSWVAPVAEAATYSWDNNGATAGFGTAGLTWADPTIGSATLGWSTNANGLAVPGTVSTTLTDALNFGTAGSGLAAGTITVSGTVNAQSLTFGSASGAIELTGGTINLGAANILSVYNATNTIGSQFAGTNGLTKNGNGTLLLNGSAVNPLTGGLNLNGGILSLDFANLATPDNLVNSSNTLALGGGNLSLLGKSTGTTNQTLGNVTVNSGGGRILGDNNGGTALNMTLGSLTATASGGSLLVGAGGVAANIPVITTTTAADATGIYGGRVVYFNGTAGTGYDWAANTGGGGPYTLTGYTGYTGLDLTDGMDSLNSRITASATLGGNRTTNSLKFENPATAQILDLAGQTLTLSSGGLLITGTSVGQGPRITNGTITAGNGSGSYDLVIHNSNATSQIAPGTTTANVAFNTTISAVIADNGGNPVTLVKNGPGPLLLNGANTFTGGIVVNEGSLVIIPTSTLNNNSLNNNALTFNANSAFVVGSNSATTNNSGGITINNGSTVTFIANAATYNSTGAVTGVGGGIAIDKHGSGGSMTLNMNNTANTFTGPIRYSIFGPGTGTISVASLVDTSVKGAGNITFGAGAPSSTQTFNLSNFANAPLTLNNRQFELAGNQGAHVINNNSSQDFTINSDVLISGNSGKFLTLGGTGSGLNTMAGSIGDLATPNAPGTILAAVTTSGTGPLVIVGSVEGIVVGATIDGTNIVPGTTITAINPITKQLTLSQNKLAQVSPGNLITIPGVINSVSVVKTGSSIWSLSGNNSFSGGLVLNGASVGSQLNINSPTAIGTGTLTIVGGNNGKLDNTSSNPLTLTTNNAQTWNNDFNFIGSNALNLGTGPVTMGGNRNITVTANTLTVGGIVNGPFGLTKSGASGTLVLSGNNLYTGATTVNEGTLRLNGNNTAATGAVNVSALATLGGGGTVGGLTTVASTGIVAPGNSAGNLTFAAGLDLSAGGVYSWELGALSVVNPGMDFDTITVSGGNLALGGTSALTLDFGLVSANDPNSVNAFWTTGKSWKIIDVTTGTNTGDTNLSTITNASYSSGSFTTTVGGVGPDLGDIFLVFTPGVAGPATWIGASGDNWTAGTSWSGSVPNSASAEAKFTTTGGAIANLDLDQTVNKLTFDATTSNDYTISGPGKLTLAGTTPAISLAATNTGDQTITTNVELGAGTTITVSGGSLSLNVPTTNPVLGAGVTATVATGATLNLGGAGNALSNGTTTHANVTNNGTLAATTAGKRVGNITGTGTTNVTAASATLTATSIRQSVLSIGATSQVNLTPSLGNKPAGISVFTNTAATSLSIATGGNFDVNDNDLIVYYQAGQGATTLATIQQQIIDGFLGTSGVAKISTSTGAVDMDKFLVAIDNGGIGLTSWEGVTLTGTDQIIVKYTLFGDLNLDGTVDSFDYSVIDSNFGTGNSWLTGDSNLDGMVDSFDYSTVDTHFGKSFPMMGGGAGLSIAAIPEPSTFVLGGLAVLGLAGYRLRRRGLKTGVGE